MQRALHVLFFSSITVLSLAMSSVFFVALPAQKSNALSGTCPSTIDFLQPFQGQTLYHTKEIILAGNEQVRSVRFIYNGQSIGRGFREPEPGSEWRMPWDTRFSPNTDGTNKPLVASITFEDNQTCTTAPRHVQITNTEARILDIVVNPPSWNGLTNTVAYFNVDYPNNTTGIDLNRYADVQWSVFGVGSVIAQPFGVGKYNSGPSSGSGMLKAKVFYGGQNKLREIPLSVTSQTQQITPDSGSTTTNDGQSSGGTSTSTDQGSTTDKPTDTQTTTPTTQKELIQKAFQSDASTRQCISDKIGADTLNKIEVEGRRPTAEQFKLFLICYSRQKYVLPSVIAPVAPEKVKEIKESSKIKLNKPRNAPVLNLENGSFKEALVFSGTAEPNSVVLLYVFSEPLVLATTADDDGNWSYSVEDPLEPGEHEVYALVEKGDGEYERSSLSSFVVQTAEATESNPNGYSLALKSEPTIAASNRSVNLYVAATVGVFAIVAIGITLYVLRKKSVSALLTPSHSNTNDISDRPHKFNDSL